MVDKRRASTNGERVDVAHVESDRMRLAGARAAASFAAVKRQAKKVTQELDEVTAPHGVQTTELHEEDSLVTSVAEVIATVSK